MNLADPLKKNDSAAPGEETLPEPQIELTGFNQPSVFGQLMSSGLNVISTLSGKKKNPSAAPIPIAPAQPKSKETSYKPTWNKDNFDEPNIEHTNFTSAISEFNKQQDNPKMKRGAPPPVVIRKQKPPMPFIYKFAIFSVFVVLGLGTFMYADKKYNIRKTIQEMKDPSKAKLKVKRKPAVIEE